MLNFQYRQPNRTTMDLALFLGHSVYIVRSEIRCALRLRYVDLVQTCIDPLGHHFQYLL
jgi:hypothetical protein